MHDRALTGQVVMQRFHQVVGQTHVAFSQDQKGHTGKNGRHRISPEISWNKVNGKG